MKKLLGLFVFVALFFVAQASASAESTLQQVANSALGTPYKWSGTTLKGFDCSGYTSYVFSKLDVQLPHSSSAQAQLGTEVDSGDLRTGDLVFFRTGGGGISHVGIYMGKGTFYHSASGKGVVASKLSEAYYTRTYVTARRVLTDSQYEQFAAEPVATNVATGTSKTVVISFAGPAPAPAVTTVSVNQPSASAVNTSTDHASTDATGTAATTVATASSANATVASGPIIEGGTYAAPSTDAYGNPVFNWTWGWSNSMQAR